MSKLRQIFQCGGDFGNGGKSRWHCRFDCSLIHFNLYQDQYQDSNLESYDLRTLAWYNFFNKMRPGHGGSHQSKKRSFPPRLYEITSKMRMSPRTAPPPHFLFFLTLRYHPAAARTFFLVNLLKKIRTSPTQHVPSPQRLPLFSLTRRGTSRVEGDA